MKLHRFIGDFKIAHDHIQVTDPELVNQMKNVLKLSVEEKVSLIDDAGHEFICEIESTDKHRVMLRVIEEVTNDAEPEISAHLYLAVLKRENFELAVQKAVEAGISEIFPVHTERTIKTNLNLERIRKIAKEAAEQSGRARVPRIHEIQNVRDTLSINKDRKKILFDRAGTAFTRADAKNFDIYIGPEGGWTDAEIQAGKEADSSIMALGVRTLRAETAAIIATYLITS